MTFLFRNGWFFLQKKYRYMLLAKNFPAALISIFGIL